jgi:hypothetical protein
MDGFSLGPTAREIATEGSMNVNGTEMMASTVAIAEILADPSTSDWLRAAVHATMRRDPVDRVYRQDVTQPYDQKLHQYLRIVQRIDALQDTEANSTDGG